jgi:hypothetical protein
LEYPEFCGIMMNFERERQVLSARKKRTDGIEYFYVLGYYNHLTISEIESYEKYSPSFEERLGELGDHEETYRRSANSYLMRITVPSGIEDDIKYPNKIFSYSTHDIKAAEHKCKPFLTTILLNFSKEAIKEKGLSALTKIMSEIIKVVADEHNKKQGTKQAFAIYNCLGSTDCVIICRTNNFSIVTNLLMEIRNRTKLICASYFIPTIAAFFSEEDKKNALESIKNSGVDEDNEFSILATLRPGAVWSKLRTDLEDFCELHNITGKECEIPYTASYISGVPDLLLRYTGNPSVLCKLILYEDSPFRYKTDEDSIISTQTAFIQPINGGNSEQSVDLYLKKRQAKEEKMREDFISVMQAHVEHDLAHGKRIYNGMLSMLHSYFELTENSGNFDIAYMIDGFIEGFIKMLKQSNEFCLDNQALYADSDIALNIFREHLSRIIGDFSKSNRNWLEGRLLTHKVLGSTKKIVTVIYSIIKELDEKIRPKDNGEESEFHFIVTSGGVDTFQAKRFFDHINGKINRRLIIITLPEKYLFCGLRTTTIFQVFHEYFHFANSDVREKRLRKECYLKTLSLYITKVSIIRSTDYGIKDRLKAALTQKGIDVNRSEVKTIFEEYLDVIADWIHKNIVYPILSDELINNENIMYFKDILEKIEGILKDMLDPVDKEKGAFLFKAESYDEAETNNVLVKPLLFQTESIHKIVNCMIFVCNQISQYVHAESEARKSNLRRNFTLELDKWLSSSHIKKNSSIAYSQLKIHFLYDIQRLFEYISGRIGSTSIEAEYDPYANATLLKDLFRESFADVCSIYVTDCNAKDYIEIIATNPKRNVNGKNIGEILRLFVTLDICFDDDEVNNAILSTPTSITKAYEEWVVEYARLRNLKITEPLEYYLNKCINMLSNKIELRKFKPINDLKSIKNENSYSSQEIDFLDKLYAIWGEID